MTSDLTQLFIQKQQEHFNTLKSQLVESLAEADDKEYAKTYYVEKFTQTILNWKNESIFFWKVMDELNHQIRLSKDNGFQAFIDDLGRIRQEAEVEIQEYGNELLVANAMNPSDELTSMLEREESLLKLSEIELVNRIAQYSAAIQLKKKYSQPKKQPLEGISQKLEDKLPFTRNQQLLATYFVLKQAGIEPRKTTEISNYTRLVHLLSNTSYKKVQDGMFYKKVSILPNISIDRALKLDLLKIRKYFVEIESSAIVDLIDIEIKRCSSDL